MRIKKHKADIKKMPNFLSAVSQHWLNNEHNLDYNNVNYSFTKIKKVDRSKNEQKKYLI